MSPRVTVVVPVYNRTLELQRALVSLKQQTFPDFECLIIDDCSDLPIEPLVAAMSDDRFRYIRNSRNGGPYNARVHGYRHMAGEYLLQLDSDWEAYPWALAQGIHYLDTTPEVDAVSAMHLRHGDSSMFTRVRGGRKIMTPDEYVKSKLGPDCVAMVRRNVVDEWLKKRDDYFAFEFHQWFTFSLGHHHLYVDEPWTIYHVEGGDRVSRRIDQRQVDDYMKFMEEHDEYLKNLDAPFLSEMLVNIWYQLLRNHRHAERQKVEVYLRYRKTSIFGILAAKLRAKLLRMLMPGHAPEKGVFYI